MAKTVKSIIGDFCVQKLTQKNKEYHEVGTPRLFIDITKKAIEQYKYGEFKVGGMSKKHPVDEVDVDVCWVAPAITYNYALPAKGEEVETEILYLHTKKGGYYYDYFNNTIGTSLEEIHIKEGSVGEFKSFLVDKEKDDPSPFFIVYYTMDDDPNSPVMSILLTSYFGEDSARDRFSEGVPYGVVQNIVNLTKGEAMERGLNITETFDKLRLLNS